MSNLWEICKHYKVAFRVRYLFWSISGWRLLWLEAQRDTQCVCLCIVCVRDSVWRNRWYFYTAGSDFAQGFCHTLSPSTTRFMVSDFTSLHRRKLQTVEFFLRRYTWVQDLLPNYIHELYWHLYKKKWIKYLKMAERCLIKKCMVRLMVVERSLLS